MTSDVGDARGVARSWGYNEDDPRLALLHTQIVAAILAGAPTTELWKRYLEDSTYLIDSPPGGPATTKARAGREIFRGLIWLEAGEIVTGLSYLLLAEATASNNNWTTEEEVLGREIDRHGTAAEYRQAVAYYFEDAQDSDSASDNFEAALAIYREAEEDDSITDAHRGLVNHHMAECYLGLLRIGAGDPELLQEQIVGSLESASQDRLGTPGFLRTQALLDQVSQEDWWEDAVRRQQA